MGLRSYSEKRRAERDADSPRRLAALHPAAAARWTNLVSAAAAQVEPMDPAKPCAYGRRVRAIAAVSGGPVECADRYYGWNNEAPDAVGGLMSFLYDAMSPGWSEDHEHLVEFALTFLEADVMLFRTGYDKRHLLRRLRQADLSPEQKERAEALVGKAVVEGTGLEEYREFCRLAANLNPDGLSEWLERLAEGAYVTVDDFDIADDFVRLLEARPEWDKAVARHDRSLQPVWSFPADLIGEKVKRKDLPPDNRIKRNAWRMKRYLDRRGL